MIKTILMRVVAASLIATSASVSSLMAAAPCLPACVANFADCLPVTADFVIVGLGTAGATLARYLSDPAPAGLGASVIVIEAGYNLALNPLVMAGGPFLGNSPGGYLPLYSVTYGANYGDFVAGVQGLFAGVQSAFYDEGRMWGGSSAHNYFITVRGSPNFYNTIASQVANAQWNYANLEPFMIGMEDFIPNGIVATDNRGTTGNLIISQETPVEETSHFLIGVTEVANCPFVPDYNDPSYGNNGVVGLSAQQIYSTLPVGGDRTFSVQAFLPQSVIDYNTGLGLNGRKLRVISGAFASKVLFQQTTGGVPQATGVEYILSDTPNTVLQVYANKSVILCGGAIQDPALLQRSGIGNPAVLDPLGIPVLVDQVLVGSNLRNQYGPCAILPIEPTSGDLADPFPVFELDLAFVNLSTSTALAVPFQNTFYNGTPGVRRNEMLLQRGPFQFPVPGLLPFLNGGVALTSQNCVAVITTILTPHSQGTVNIVTSDPLIAPQIDFNFFTDGNANTNGTDLNQAIAALLLLADVAEFNTTPTTDMIYPPRSFYPVPYGPLAAGNYSSLVEAAQNVYVVMNHAAGTCQMGPNIGTGVVSSADLSVFGVANGSLRVASNSVWPQTLDGNTAYYAYLLGLKLATILGATDVPQINP